MELKHSMRSEYDPTHPICNCCCLSQCIFIILLILAAVYGIYELSDYLGFS